MSSVAEAFGAILDPKTSMVSATRGLRRSRVQQASWTRQVVRCRELTNGCDS